MNTLFDVEDIAREGKCNEWYTPKEYIEAARETMRSIDLDVASCEVANRVVKAGKYYTKEDDGLSQPWHGNVWCNPPFTSSFVEKGGLYKSCIALFVNKIVQEYKQRNIEQAILLSIPNTDTKWFQQLWDYPICFTDHRLKFYGKQTYASKTNSNRFGTIFVYFGQNEAKFIELFSQFGRIVKAISAPKPEIQSTQSVQQPTLFSLEVSREETSV